MAILDSYFVTVFDLILVFLFFCHPTTLSYYIHALSLTPLSPFKASPGKATAAAATTAAASSLLFILLVSKLIFTWLTLHSTPTHYTLSHLQQHVIQYSSSSHFGYPSKLCPDLLFGPVIEPDLY